MHGSCDVTRKLRENEIQTLYSCLAQQAEANLGLKRLQKSLL